jgi:hypothetical protein
LNEWAVAVEEPELGGIVLVVAGERDNKHYVINWTHGNDAFNEVFNFPSSIYAATAARPARCPPSCRMDVTFASSGALSRAHYSIVRKVETAQSVHQADQFLALEVKTVHDRLSRSSLSVVRAPTLTTHALH